MQPIKNLTSDLTGDLTSVATGLAIFALTSVSPVLSATDTLECNDLAPGFSKEQLNDGEGSYYNFDGLVLRPELTRDATAFSERLLGRWTGKVTRETCKGHYTNPKWVKKDFVVRAEGGFLFNGDFRLEAELDSPRVFKIRKLFLSTKRTHSIEQLDSSTWVFIEKYRAGGASTDLVAPGGTGRANRMVHEIKTVRLTGDDEGTVDHIVYVNGFLVARDSWSLTRV